VTSPPAPIPFLGAFESTFQPAHDRDVVESTGHDLRWRDDLALLAAAGVDRLRYPIRWHRIEARPGELDWSHTDEVLGHMRSHGLRPIVDLVHHTSYPRWLDAGFADRRFPEAYLRYVEAFCRRYPWVEEYTLFNEPFSTLFLCGHEGIWPPYLHGVHGVVNLYRNVLPALTEASRLARRLLPAARHVWVDTCEHHTGRDTWGRAYADYANDRRFFVLDAFLGRLDDGFRRPFVKDVIHEGGGSLLDLEPGHIDVLGLDYYAHCQWSFAEAGAGNVIPTPDPLPLHEQIQLYAERYATTVSLTETNIRGEPSDRATWLKYTLEQCEKARAAGVDLDGYCWFPFIDSADWGSLLYRCEGEIDPVGVYSIGEGHQRLPSSMTASFSAAAGGARAAELPAYELQSPAREWLAGYRHQMAGWDWVPPPAEEIVERPEVYEMELRIRDA
jgi:beta-glucosidase/6-phospho-beta-glucosidase/beta-galactosidase